MQLAARRRLVRLQGTPAFPRWPLELGVSRLVRFFLRCLIMASDGADIEFKWFWPAPYSAALVLTHDVETAEGLRLAVELADLEEERGLRSSFNIVGDWYPIDAGIVGELRGRGFEIGLHGIHHDRSLFSSEAVFESQLPALQELGARLGAVGFRSPSTFREHTLLARLPFEYDCSVPHSDPYEPQPGGCCSIWPFFEGEVVEIPYTLPQDHTLFTLLRHRTPEVWIRQLGELEGLYGVIQAPTHPDPGYLGDAEKRAAYAEFLTIAAERDSLWKTLPCAVARWWRRRDAGTEERHERAQGRASLDEEKATMPGGGVTIEYAGRGNSERAADPHSR